MDMSRRPGGQRGGDGGGAGWAEEARACQCIRGPVAV